MKKSKIAIIGGGVAGSSVALYLSKLNIDVTLFEKSKSLVNGPPICHLHAGGNLYREISDDQCVTLLKESIELVRFYPDAVDYRPTVIATPIDDPESATILLDRLELLKKEYQKLVDENSANKVLGESEAYYKLYSREDVEKLKLKEIVQKPQTLDEWMIPVAKGIDLDRVKYPLIMVQEYGLNVFRLGASAIVSLENMQSTTLRMNSKVESVSKEGNHFILSYKHNSQQISETFDYLINAAGFRSGEIDDMLGYKRDRFVEFKAAYVTKWSEANKSENIQWPEVIFHGKRGTPQGMAQFTPYPNGYIQLHGMTNDITLFENGLVKSEPSSSQPRLHEKFITKIDKEWKKVDLQRRTEAAIDHMSKFIPSFKSAEVASKPLYGAQQIPGHDDTLRAAEVSFEGRNYARCEIVKASSVITMADAIVKKLILLDFVTIEDYSIDHLLDDLEVEGSKVDSYAQKLCSEREYPLHLAHRNVTK